MCWGDARPLSDARSLKLNPRYSTSLTSGPRLTAPLGFQILQSDQLSNESKLPLTPRLRPSAAPFDLELLDSFALPDSAVQMPSEPQLHEAMPENARKACRKPRLRPSAAPFDIELLEAFELPESAIQVLPEHQFALTDEPTSSGAPRELGLSHTNRQSELELLNSAPQSARARKPPAAPRLRPRSVPLQSLQLLPFLELPESVVTGTPSTPRLVPTNPPFGVDELSPLAMSESAVTMTGAPRLRASEASYGLENVSNFELPSLALRIPIDGVPKESLEGIQTPSKPSSILTILSSLQKRNVCRVDDTQELGDSNVEEETLIFELDDDDDNESSCATEDTLEFSLEEIVSSAVPTADCSQNFKVSRALQMKPWGASQFDIREKKVFEDESPLGSSLCSTCASPPTPSMLCKETLITDQVGQL